MDWFQKNYDRVILLIVSLATIALSVVLVLKSFAFPENFVIKEVTPNNDLPPSRTGFVDDAIVTLQNPSYITPPEVDGKGPRIFISFPIVEKDADIFDMSENDNPLREKDGVSVDNTWLVENELDFLNKNVLEQDADRDGFTNFEEWTEKKQPDDAKDTPPIHRKLFLVKRRPDNYVMEFRARPDDKTFQLARYLPTPTQTGFFKVGDEFFKDNPRFRIEKYTPQTTVQPSGLRVDVSELEVTDTETSEQFVLVYRQRLNRPTYYAAFVFTLGGETEFEVKLGEEFGIPGLDGKFRLKELTEDQAVIETVPAPGETPEILTIKKKL